MHIICIYSAVKQKHPVPPCHQRTEVKPQKSRLDFLAPYYGPLTASIKYCHLHGYGPLFTSYLIFTDCLEGNPVCFGRFRRNFVVYSENFIAVRRAKRITLFFVIRHLNTLNTREKTSSRVVFRTWRSFYKISSSVGKYIYLCKYQSSRGAGHWLTLFY